MVVLAKVGVFRRAFLAVRELHVVQLDVLLRCGGRRMVLVGFRRRGWVHLELLVVGDAARVEFKQVCGVNPLVKSAVITSLIVARTLLYLLKCSARRTTLRYQHVVWHLFLICHIDKIAHIAPMESLRLHHEIGRLGWWIIVMLVATARGMLLFAAHNTTAVALLLI